MSLKTIGDKLLLSGSGALATSCDCCEPPCKQCYCFNAYDYCRTTVYLNIKYQQTITVPQQFSLPVRVTAVGGADDAFALDGDPNVFGQPNFKPAGDFNFTWIQESRTFTIAAKDWYGSCTGIGYTLCIGPASVPAEAFPALPECSPIIRLIGDDPTERVPEVGSTEPRSGIEQGACP